jgi:predicted PurR-regulated permease PerM
LQFTLGFLGSAIWFFYRKMYKLAILFVAIGLVFTTVTTILTYDEQISTSRDVLENFYQFLDESESDDVNPQSNIIEDIENAPDSNTTIIKPGIAKVLGWIEQFVGTAIVGMFALYFYKKRCIKKIIEFKNSEVGSRYYSYCLGLVGGTSGGMLAIGIIIAFLVTTVVESTVILQLLYLHGG